MNYLFCILYSTFVDNVFLYVGQEPGDQVIDDMMSQAPGPLNFTMFLTLFGEKLTGKWYLIITIKDW